MSPPGRRFHPLDGEMERAERALEVAKWVCTFAVPLGRISADQADRDLEAAREHLRTLTERKGFM